MLTNMVRCLYDTPVPTMHTYQRYDCEELIFVYTKKMFFLAILKQYTFLLIYHLYS